MAIVLLLACACLTGPSWELEARWSSHGGSLGGSSIREAGVRAGAARVIWLDVRTRQPSLDPPGWALKRVRPRGRIRWSTYWLCESSPGIRGIAATLPLWIPAAAIALPLAIVVWRGRAPAGYGRCAACGYDLAGLAAGAVCPECGETREPTTAAT